MSSSLIRKRIAEIVTLMIFCSGLALVGTMAFAAVSIVNEDRTALAQESGGASGQNAEEGGTGQAEDGVEGQDDVYVLCDDGGIVPAGSTQSVTCEVSNDTGYNISLSVTTTGGVHSMGASLGSRRPDRTYRATVRVRVDRAGSFTLRAEDHLDWG